MRAICILTETKILLSCFLLLTFLRIDSSGYGQYPSVIDNSKTPWFPANRNQGDVGSCDWFACAYYQMTYLKNRQENREWSESTCFSPKFGFTLVNNGKHFPYNLWFVDVYEILKKHGCPTLADFPYDLDRGGSFALWCTDSLVWRKAAENRIKGYESYDFRLDRVKELLSRGEVLVIQFNPQNAVYMKAKNNPEQNEDDEFENDYVIASGIQGPDHTVCVVGYNDHIWIDRNEDGKVDPAELGAIKIAESIDDGFVNDGFRWMSYACVNQPSNTLLFENKIWRMLLNFGYTPGFIAQIVIDHAEPRKLKMQIGKSSEAIPELAKEVNFIYDPFPLGFQPGASGKSLIEGNAGNNCEGDLTSSLSYTFDLTDHLKAQDFSSGYFFLRLENSGLQNGIVKNFKIIDKQNGKELKCKSLPFSFYSGESFIFINTQDL